MNRTIVLLGVVLATYLGWYLTETPDHTPVVVLAHPALIAKSVPASGVPHLFAWPAHDQPASALTRQSVTPLATFGKGVTPHLKQYVPIPEVQAFDRRRFDEKTEPLTEEERAKIIIALKDRIDQSATDGGRHHVEMIARDLRLTKISPSELGDEYAGKLLGLTQKRIMEQARNVEERVGKGCFYDAAQTAGLSMQLLRSTLKDELADWYQNEYLDGLLERAYAAIPNGYSLLDDSDLEQRRLHLGCG